MGICNPLGKDGAAIAGQVFLEMEEIGARVTTGKIVSTAVCAPAWVQQLGGQYCQVVNES